MCVLVQIHLQWLKMARAHALSSSRNLRVLLFYCIRQSFGDSKYFPLSRRSLSSFLPTERAGYIDASVAIWILALNCTHGACSAVTCVGKHAHRN
mmetsp:Transcript_10505/g.64334  ORF Transcript_10505/g.64334 Transcript_10505/m.64334 type:complete len:95 (+) Transcript_10505:3077-3361(+)